MNSSNATNYSEADNPLEYINLILEDLLVDTKAQYVFLFDPRGFVISYLRAAQAPEPPSVDALASLITSSFSAASALSHLFQKKSFNSIVQYGEQNIYVREVNPKALLVCIFGNDTTAQRVVYKIDRNSDMLKEAFLDLDPSYLLDQLSKDQNWVSYNEELLDNLFDM